MADEHSADKPKRAHPRRKGVGIDMPGLEADVSEETAQTFMQYTGDSWRWVVKALAWSVFWGGTCWGLSWLI